MSGKMSLPLSQESPRSVGWLLPAGCGAWIAAALWLTGPPRPPTHDPADILGWYFAGFLAYLLMVWLAFRKSRVLSGPLPFALILLFALAFRLIAFWREPGFSSDIYRYLWDGRLANLGINPFRFAPADPSLAPYRDWIWSHINYKPITTIYPPLAQMVFAALYRIMPDNPAAFRALFMSFDLASIPLIVLILREVEQPRCLAVIYAWHPLVVGEFAAGGHVDSLGIFLLLLSLWLWAKSRGTAAGFFLGLAAMAKGLPVLALPFMAKRGKLPFVAAFLIAGLICVLPYLGAGPALFGGLNAYLGGWEANAGLFALIKQGAGFIFPPGDFWPRLIAGILFAAGYLWLFTRPGRARATLGHRLTVALGGFLLLSATVFPWYLTWLAALVSISFSPALWVWTITVALHYVRMFADPRHSSYWLYFEYLPVYTILVLGVIRERKLHNTARREETS